MNAVMGPSETELSQHSTRSLSPAGGFLVASSSFRIHLSSPVGSPGHLSALESGSFQRESTRLDALIGHSTFRRRSLSLVLSLDSCAHAGSDRMATAFAPRMSMPGTPRGNGTTPRSARRLQSTPSSRLSFGGNSLGAVNHAAAAALAPLPPINTRTYPDRSYADDDELRDLMERDKVAVDDAVSILGHALASTRKRLVESLEEIAAEHKRLERLTRELGDAAKDMVKTVQREKDEMDKAKSLENEVQTRARSLAVQVETANGEVKEIQARLQARRERERFFRCLGATTPLCSFCSRVVSLPRSQSKAARRIHESSRPERTRTRLSRTETRPLDPRQSSCVSPMFPYTSLLGCAVLWGPNLL